MNHKLFTDRSIHRSNLWKKLFQSLFVLLLFIAGSAMICYAPNNRWIFAGVLVLMWGNNVERTNRGK